MHLTPLAIALDRQTLMILALSILAGAALVVAAGGWVLVRRLRRAPAPPAVQSAARAVETPGTDGGGEMATTGIGEMDAFDALDALDRRTAGRPPS